MGMPNEETSLSSFSILQPHAAAAAWIGVLTANNVLNLRGTLAAGRGKQEFHPDWRNAGDVWKSGRCLHVLDRNSSCVP